MASIPVIMATMVSVMSVASMEGVISMNLAMVVTVMMVIMMVHWFHLENQIAARRINIRWIEN